MKLALGTVQFGVNYGINNKNGIPSDFDISEIFAEFKILLLLVDINIELSFSINQCRFSHE